MGMCVCVCYCVNAGLLLIMCLSRRIRVCKRRNYVCSASLLLFLSLIHTMLQCLKRIIKLVKKTPISGLYYCSVLIQPFSPVKCIYRRYRRNLLVVDWTATAVYERRLQTAIHCVYPWFIYL